MYVVLTIIICGNPADCHLSSGRVRVCARGRNGQGLDGWLAGWRVHAGAQPNSQNVPAFSLYAFVLLYCNKHARAQGKAGVVSAAFPVAFFISLRVLCVCVRAGERAALKSY
jgi:hypothetical protein